LFEEEKNNPSITVSDVLNDSFVNTLINHDDGFRMLNQVRSSPGYWENKKKNLFSMIRQLGKPTLFLTLSSAEKFWPELLQLLSKLLHNKQISIEQALSLSDYEKTLLIRNDPITCARYFDQKVSKLMNYIKEKDYGPFGKHNVIDTYERVEFQMRGSPHEHIFLWLKDPPNNEINEENNKEACVEFIDKYITCNYQEDNPYMNFIKHRHTHTCYKGKKNKNKCRFNFPIPMMPFTTILSPLEKELQTKEIKLNFKRIKNLMHSLFMNPQNLTFNDVLEELALTQEEYFTALKSSLSRPQVFLKRGSLEVGINSYNTDLLNIFEANIDVQLIFEEYGLASYIVNYISKIDSGMVSLLREAASDISQGIGNSRDKLKKIANIFLNSNLMSSQEAAYHVLSLPLSKSSRSTVFINTSRINERVMMLK
jgi:hypothetical protein